MRPKWVIVPLVVIKEMILLALLSIVVNTMLAGVFALAIYNIPQVVWDSQGIDRVILVFIIIMAPIFALARVIEWWINLYRRFSVFFP